ncbi:unnamed protein product [Commensalibacter communis]|uniref:hypothetical protein n=1 Tax=Commensalibacter communis TaxID=2972786 RepID=UPI0022FFAD0D|nr:hypothetical protein [Commensalibacter communis]CAI3949893.1 unnamed protein product [Commensalibacter communis]CAI3955355.1 unnamed protein product [Commensalibacter communis]CAI3956966.1 unnamed protein product [Commensalibacter communis]
MGNYVTLAVAISTGFIGMITCIIAYSQMKIASAKVKLDLYERRFNIYVTALNCYRALYKKQPEEIAKYTYELMKSCREAQFLFKEDDVIYEILTKMHRNGGIIEGYREYISQNANRSKVNSDIFHKDSVNALREFEKNLMDLETKIKPYIQFENVKGWTFF